MKEDKKPYQLKKNVLDWNKLVKELQKKGIRFYEAFQKKGELVPYHSHPYPELIAVIHGKMRLIIEEDILDLESNDLLTISPHAAHLACFPYQGGCHFLIGVPEERKENLSLAE